MVVVQKDVQNELYRIADLLLVMIRKALLMNFSILLIDGSSQFPHTGKQYKIIGCTKA